MHTTKQNAVERELFYLTHAFKCSQEKGFCEGQAKDN